MLCWRDMRVHAVKRLSCQCTGSDMAIILIFAKSMPMLSNSGCMASYSRRAVYDGVELGLPQEFPLVRASLVCTRCRHCLLDYSSSSTFRRGKLCTRSSGIGSCFAAGTPRQEIVSAPLPVLMVSLSCFPMESEFHWPRPEFVSCSGLFLLQCGF